MSTISLKGLSEEHHFPRIYVVNVIKEHEPFVDLTGYTSDCCGRDVEYDKENDVWFCGCCGEPCGVM